MTNAEKFLKNENYTKDFISDYKDYCVRKKQDSINLESLSLFFREEVKPQLTESERVILKNINTNVYDVIGRDSAFTLYIAGQVDWRGNKVSTRDYIEQFLKSSVFQFIKER